MLIFLCLHKNIHPMH